MNQVASMVRTLGKDFFETATSKGLSEVAFQKGRVFKLEALFRVSTLLFISSLDF